MNLARSFVLLGVAVALTVFSSPAEAARKKGKKTGGVHGHHGMVESVNHKTGTFTIKARHHHKSGMAGKGKGGRGKGMGRRGKGNAGKAGAGNRGMGANMTFQVHRGTKFQGGSFQNVQKGKHVTVMSQGPRADAVKIGGTSGGKGKPKRKKKANV